MTINLKNRVALVTGSSKGIGLQIALALGESGAKVTICARNEEELIQAHEQMNQREYRIQSSFVVVDATKDDAAQKAVDHVINKWGSLDILVNNVGGITQTGHFVNLSDQDWYDCFTLNTMTVVRFCREAIPFLKKSNSPRIINISSFVAMQPGAFNPHYSACKSSIVNLSKYLSNYLAKDGILVNCVSPGVIHTEGWNNYISKKSIQENKPIEEIKDAEECRVVRHVPLNRFGFSEEVGSVVVFLASDAAAFITGDNLRIDGGRTKSV